MQTADGGQQMKRLLQSAPIGVFDSGVGGLSVWRYLVQRLPQEPTLYFADQSHLPYGPRPREEVRRYAEEITRFLVAQGAKLIVVACNSASGPALHGLRETFPDVPFVGMEPAIKPAAERTRTGVIGVIATPATFQGELFQGLVERFAGDVTLKTQTCPGLVEAVEEGALDTPETEALIRKYLTPMLAAGIDHLVLGCTHYPFLSKAFQRVTGPSVTLIDPAPAVARQVERVLARRGLLTPGSESVHHTFYTSGDPTALAAGLDALVGYTTQVEPVLWREGGIVRRRGEAQSGRRG
ncbi:MAG: glutamate racemase [Anaerolineales bacterium]